MILSDADIARRLEEGDLVVDPLDDPDLQIQPASVDLRLGRSFLEFQHANIACIHPESERETEEYVDETVVREDGEYVLHPGDFVLGTTRERVEIPPDLIAHVEGRSSLGRLAVVVHASLPYDEEVLLWTPTEGLEFHEIGEVVETEQPARAVAFDPRTLRVSTHRVTDYITNPTQRIHRVRLRSGREVRVTKDHNLFTLDERGGVTRIPSQNAEGQFVMVPATLPESPGTVREVDVLDLLDPEETTLYASDGSGEVDRSAAPDGPRESSEQRDGLPMTAVPRSKAPAGVEAAVGRSDTRLPRELPLTPEFGWALGFYVAEGSTRQAQIRVSDADRDRLDRFAAFFDPYDVDLSWEDDEQTTTLTVRSATWSRVFRELTGTGSPLLSVLNWPETVLDALLEGVLDGSGRREKARERLYTASLELANRLAYLGTRLGRPTSVHRCERCENDPGSAGRSWVVDFGGDTSECERVPVPSELLRDLRQETGITPSAVADAAGWSSDTRVSTLESEACQTVERGTLERTRDAYRELDGATDRLDQILDGDVRFEEVVAVERTDRVEPTYDLEVQPNGRAIENFVGGRGGVFLSNTAGLCDPGYEGQITLELSNLGRAPVALTPGMRVSQLTFTELTSPAERPYGSERGSKYQGQSGPVASRIQDDAEFGGDQ